MSQLERPKRAIIDVHEVLMQTEAEDAFLVDSPVTAEFIDHARKASQMPLPAEQKFRQILSAVVPGGIFRWGVLEGDAPEKLLMVKQFMREHRFSGDTYNYYQELNKQNYDQYFGSYKADSDQCKGLQKLQETGFKSTICTSIPFSARWMLVERLIHYWQFLDPNLSAVFRQTLQLSGIHLKPALALVREAEGEDVYLIDNDLYVARVVAVATRNTSTKVFVLGDKEAAYNQPHLRTLNFPYLTEEADSNIVFIDNVGEVADHIGS